MEAFMQVIQDLMRSKDISKEEMMKIITESLKDAYIRKYKLKEKVEEDEEYNLPLEVEIDDGKLYVFISKEVKEEVDDKHKEISIEKAKEILEITDIEAGD